MASINAAYLNSYMNSYLMSSGSTSAASAPFDIASVQATAKQEAASLLSTYKSNQAEIKTLKADTAKYLDNYSVAMKTMGQSADKLRNGGIDKVLYNSNGEVTDETVAATVKAVQDMVTNYNDTLKLLNDNAERGAGTTKQLSRMVTDPAPSASMKMVGITVNDDATLSLDTEALTSALKTTTPGQLDLYKDILGGYGGVADGIQKDALYGSNMSAQSLVGSDLAEMQTLQNENPFKSMYDSFRGNVFALNNQAVTGLLMNMLV